MFNAEHLAMFMYNSYKDMYNKLNPDAPIVPLWEDMYLHSEEGTKPNDVQSGWIVAAQSSYGYLCVSKTHTLNPDANPINNHPIQNKMIEAAYMRLDRFKDNFVFWCMATGWAEGVQLCVLIPSEVKREGSTEKEKGRYNLIVYNFEQLVDAIGLFKPELKKVLEPYVRGEIEQLWMNGGHKYHAESQEIYQQNQVANLGINLSQMKKPTSN